MATRTVLVLIMLAMISIIFVPLDSGFAQDTKGRWVLGFHGGGNMWVDDYNQRLVGPGGEIMVRYGITRGFSAGLLTGYVWYEFVHLAEHGAWRLPMLRRLTRHHAWHHFKDWERAFGVTTPLWDWVFGTLPQSRASKTLAQAASKPAS